MIGDEFKTARLHLLKNLDGNIAWKDPVQAQQQRERLSRQRLEQQAQTQQSTPSVVAVEEHQRQEQLTETMELI